MLAIIISYIMAILFLVNLCNALSDFHRISDGVISLLFLLDSFVLS